MVYIINSCIKDGYFLCGKYPSKILFLKNMLFENLGKNKKEYRYYNQIILYYNNVLKKIKYTRQKSYLNRQQRIENLKNSFIVNKKYRSILDKKNIIISDDVFSKGAIFHEIFKLFKTYGVKKIIGIVFAMIYINK